MTRKLYIAVLFLLAFAGPAAAQSYWLQRGSGATADEGNDISIDGAGNTYTTGYYSTTVTFGNNTTLSSAGTSDIFVTKTGLSGNIVWAVSAGGTGPDRGLSIKSDAAGNTVVTGFFSGTATFGSVSLISAGNEDVFIAKYDNSGTLLWAKRAGGPGSDIGNAVNIDNNGNVLVTGQFMNTAQFGSTTLTSQGGSIDVFTAKYDASGNFVWVEQGAAPQTDRGLDVAADGAGNVYVTGQFSDTILFGQVHNNNMLNAIFLIKYNSAGVEQWFVRIGGGSINIAYGIAVDNNNDVYLTGDFGGNLLFFTNPFFTLTPVNTENIFLAKFSSSGALLWADAEGSASAVSSRNVALDNSANIYIVGTFQCKFTDYSAQYGPATFNSVGFDDIFTAKYTSSGTRLWMRQCGGQQNDRGAGIAADNNGDAYITGSFNQQIIFPYSGNFTFQSFSSPFPSPVSSPTSPGYCSDTYYNSFYKIPSAGSTDIIIAKGFDLSREPYDYYYHSGSSCVKPETGVCINVVPSIDYTLVCQDSVDNCGQVTLSSATNTSLQNPGPNSPGPNFTYQWSTGATTDIINATTTGTYWVTITSADGCFTSTDSIYAEIHPYPSMPTITDNQGINTNATITSPINICGGNVILTGGNYGNYTYSWQYGSSTYSTSTITATGNGYYQFSVTDSFGCTTTNVVDVEISAPLATIVPGIAIVNDLDLNDSISVCQSTYVPIVVFDSLTMPPYSCIPYGSNLTQWTITPNCLALTSCASYFYFFPTQSGTYNVNVMFIRTNPCDTDTVYLSKQVYVDIFPNPTINLITSGNVQLCPGDTALLYASGGNTYSWSGPSFSGSTNDSIFVVNPGTYAVQATVVDSNGCTGTANATLQVTQAVSPVLTTNPANGVICPNGSVTIMATGTGSFQWYGPQGALTGSTSNITVTTAGFYYCVLTDNNGCQLISNTIEITQYATPFLLALPTASICPGDSTTINLIASAGSAVQWQSPLSGSATTQVVSSPGTYVCSVTSCNITTAATITIVQSNILAQIAVTGPLTFCAGDSVVLAGNSGMSTYYWSPGGYTDDSITVFASGTYSLITTNADGCSDTSSTVTVDAVPNNTVPPLAGDTAICPGQSATLLATGSGTIAWYLDLNSGAVGSGPVYVTPALQSPVTYYVTVEDSIGCRSGATPVTVTFADCSTAPVPNVFSPNGDGINDVFMINAPGAQSIYCRIYNRWGRLIYEFGTLEGWPGTIMQSGKPAEDGVYYYELSITDFAGNSNTDHGFIQLIRAGN